MKHINPFKVKLDRRGFFRTAGLGAGALMLNAGLLNRSAQAQTTENRNFVFAYFSGGWDTLLCLDPRNPDDFSEARIRDTNIQLAWDRLPAGFEAQMVGFDDSPITFGPAIGDFKKHYQKSCLVRGISMDTLTHEVGRRYMMTGQMPAGLQATGSSIPTRIVAQQGDLAPIPNLVARAETYNKGLPNFASGLSVNSAGDLVMTLQRLPESPSQRIFSHLNAYRRRRVPCDPTNLGRNGFFDQIQESENKAQSLIDSALNEYFDFGRPEHAALREQYGLGNIRPGGLGTGFSAGEQAAIAAQALKHGVAQCVTVSLANGLDTHDESWADDHPTILRDGFNALSALIDDLESAGLMANTTIVVFSEFGRTPLLNTRDGRDHSLSSCALLIGAGIKANTVVGASSDVGLGPLQINPDSGLAVASGGITITPSNVLASVMQSAGYDPSALRTQGLPCIMA